MTNGSRPIYVIAKEIMADWPKAADENHPAGAYCVPMLSLVSVTDTYFADSAPSVIRYFLANANGWRGPKAREIKAELKSMIEGRY